MINEESLDKISSDENSDTELTGNYLKFNSKQSVLLSGDHCEAAKNKQRLLEYSLPTSSNTDDCRQKPNVIQRSIISLSRLPSSPPYVNYYSQVCFPTFPKDNTHYLGETEQKYSKKRFCLQENNCKNRKK